jgi:hypothetical protein
MQESDDRLKIAIQVVEELVGHYTADVNVGSGLHGRHDQRHRHVISAVAEQVLVLSIDFEPKLAGGQVDHNSSSTGGLDAARGTCADRHAVSLPDVAKALRLQRGGDVITSHILPKGPRALAAVEQSGVRHQPVWTATGTAAEQGLLPGRR